MQAVQTEQLEVLALTNVRDERAAYVSPAIVFTFRTFLNMSPGHQTGCPNRPGQEETESCRGSQSIRS